MLYKSILLSRSTNHFLDKGKRFDSLASEIKNKKHLIYTDSYSPVVQVY